MWRAAGVRKVGPRGRTHEIDVLPDGRVDAGGVALAPLFCATASALIPSNRPSLAPYLQGYAVLDATAAIWETADCPPMTVDKASVVCRRVSILCGMLPACRLTEAEVEWGFRTVVCMAADLTRASSARR